MTNSTLLIPLHDWESCGLPNDVEIISKYISTRFVELKCRLDMYNPVHQELADMYLLELPAYA